MTKRPKLTLSGALALVLALTILAFGEGREAWRGQSKDRDGGSGSASSTAGAFDYYALVLSWSPTHCSTPEGADDELQCARRDGRRYAFVLHGLWPQYERGYPESCPTRNRPWVPQPVIDGMLDIMPSPGLVKHEFRKHGTCSGLNATQYYELSRRLFERIEIPSRFKNPFEGQFLRPDEVVDELVAANPGLEAEMVAVACGGPGNRLRDVRICFTKAGDLRACGANEDQRRLCRADRVHVPPVRSTRRD
jgi:ribonuclease T2